MAITNPSVSAAISRARKTILGSNLNKVQSTDDELMVIPIEFSVASGSLSSQRCTSRCFMVDQTSNVYRLYHPACRPTDIYIFLEGTDTDSIAYTRTNANAGYTDITFGGALTGTFRGFIAIRYGRTVSGAIENGAVTDPSHPRSMRAMGLKPAFCGIPDVSMLYFEFAVDSSSDPTADVEGFGPIHVAHSGTGEYTVTLGVDLPTSSVAVVICEAEPAAPTTISGNSLVIDTVSGADPGATKFKVLLFCPFSSKGKYEIDYVNTSIPNVKTKRYYPLFAAHRDPVFAPFNFTTDGSGLILSSSILPKAMQFKKNGTAVAIISGVTGVDCVFSTLKLDTTGAYRAVTKSSVQTLGKLAYTLATSAASTDFSGFVFGSHTNQR